MDGVVQKIFEFVILFTQLKDQDDLPIAENIIEQFQFNQLFIEIFEDNFIVSTVATLQLIHADCNDKLIVESLFEIECKNFQKLFLFFRYVNSAAQ